MKKGIVAWLLAAVMLVTLSVGVCALAEDLSGEIRVWVMDAPSVEIVNEAAAIFNEKHPNVKVTAENIFAGDIEIQVTTAGTSGDASNLAEIVLFQDYSYAKFVENYPDLFADLTDSGIDFSDFTESKLSNSIIDGRNYGVPFDNGVAAAFWRVDYLAEAGYTLADVTDITWDKLIEIGEVVKEKTGKPMLTAVSGEPQIISMMLVSAGSAFFNPDGTVNVVDNAALKECVRVYAEMVKKGIVEEVTDWEAYYASLANGTCVGTINGCWISGSIMQAADQSGKWDVTNIPSLNGIEGATNYSNNGGSSFAVINGSANQEIAVEFLKETFAGKTNLPAQTIEHGILLCLKSAAELDAYQAPSEFYSGDAINAKLMEYAAKIPSVDIGVYYYDGIRAISVATSAVVQKDADIDEELKGVQESLEFTINN